MLLPRAPVVPGNEPKPEAGGGGGGVYDTNARWRHGTILKKSIYGFDNGQVVFGSDAVKKENWHAFNLMSRGLGGRGIPSFLVGWLNREKNGFRRKCS